MALLNPIPQNFHISGHYIPRKGWTVYGASVPYTQALQAELVLAGVTNISLVLPVEMVFNITELKKVDAAAAFSDN